MKKTFWLFLLFSRIVFAGAPGFMTFQSKIVAPDGQALEASSVSFRFTILDSAGTCVLYVEDYANTNMTGTQGVVAFPLGSGTKVFPPTATNLYEVFNNSTPSFNCQAGGTFSPSGADNRQAIMQFNDGSGWQTLPQMAINSVPFANYATRAESLGAYIATDYLRPATLPTCTAGQALTWNGTTFTCIATGGGGSTYTGVTSIANASGDITLAPAAGTGAVLVNSNAPSTTTTTGAVVITGGVGVSGAINSGGNITTLGNVSSAGSISSGSTVSAVTSMYTPQLFGTSTPSGNINIDGTSNAAKGNVLMAVTGGKVGIGNANPSSRLHVTDSQNASSYLTIENANNGNIASAGIQFKNDTGAIGEIDAPSSNYGFSHFASRLMFSGIQGVDLVASSVASGDLRMYTGGLLTSNERMRITTSGSVGIGTAVPGATLDVSGSGKISRPTGTGSIFTVNDSGNSSVVGITASSFNSYFSPSGTPSGTFRGLRNATTFNTGANSASSIYGIFNSASTTSGGGDTGTIAGIYNSAWNATGVATNLIGINNDISFSSTSTNVTAGLFGVTGTANSTLNIGVDVALAQNFSGTSDTVKGVNVAVTKFGSGAITTGYGVYIGSVQATTPFSLYAADAAAPSYFAGNVGIGNTSPSKLLFVGSNTVGTGQAVASFQNVDGTCTITPAGAGSGIACSSDERLKENFSDVEGDFALNQISRLQAVTYNFKSSTLQNRHTGYKAQEVQKIAPDFVRENEDGYLQVYYDAFIPWITEGIKLLSKRIKVIEDQQITRNELNALKSESDQKIKNLELENALLKSRLEEIEKRLGLQIHETNE